MIAVIGQFRLPPGNVDQARAAIAQVVKASLSEPGCRAYNYAEDMLEPGLIRVSELWDSREALDAHSETGHMKAWQQARAGLGFSGREIKAYSVIKAETL